MPKITIVRHRYLIPLPERISQYQYIGGLSDFAYLKDIRWEKNKMVVVYKLGFAAAKVVLEGVNPSSVVCGS